MLTIHPGPWVVAIEVGQGCDATIHDPLPASRAGGRLTCSRSAAREANRDGALTLSRPRATKAERENEATNTWQGGDFGDP